MLEISPINMVRWNMYLGRVTGEGEGEIMHESKSFKYKDLQSGLFNMYCYILCWIEF